MVPHQGGEDFVNTDSLGGGELHVVNIYFARGDQYLVNLTLPNAYRQQSERSMSTIKLCFGAGRETRRCTSGTNCPPQALLVMFGVVWPVNTCITF